MTPEEFVELYSSLPALELLKWDRKAAAQRMREWERERAGLAKPAPAATIAGYVYRYAASAGQ